MHASTKPSPSPWQDEMGVTLPSSEIARRSRTWSRATWDAYLDSLEKVSPKESVAVNEAYPVISEAIEQMLSHLTPRQREIIVAIYWGGMSERQAAKHFRISQTSVKELKQRGIMRIKSKVKAPPLSFPLVETQADEAGEQEGGQHEI